MTRILLPLGLGFVTSLVLAPLFMRLARRLGLVARPVKDRWSTREVPVLGGAAIYLGFLMGFLASGGATPWPAVPALLLGATLLFLLGLADDVIRLRPATKLVGQVVAASGLVAAGVQAGFTDIRFLAIPVTILWIVGVTNAFNLIDNMDGLCAGVGAIAAAALGAYALRFDVAPFPAVVRIAFALAGAQVGFLVFNVHPARVFMGDAGALFLGFTLSSAAILGTYQHAGNLFLILAVPVFVLAVPIFDTTFVTVVRKFHLRKISQGGRDHLSHRLVALGMSERRAVLILWGICAVLAGLGVAASYLDLFANLFLLGTAIVAVVIFAIFLGEIAIYRPAEGETAATLEIRKTFLNYVRGTSLVALDLLLICLAYIASYLVKFEGGIPDFDRARLLESLPVVIIGKFSVFQAFRLYQGMWRYYGVRDLLRLLQAVTAGSVASVVLIVLFFRFGGYSRALFVIDAMVLFLLVAGSRFLFRALTEARRFPPHGRRVLVVGAGDRGELCLRSLPSRQGGTYTPVGILSADRRLKARKILGVPILGTLDDLERVTREVRAEEVVLARPEPPEDLALLRERCARLGIPLFLAPASSDFVPL
jgi:UDP-GlcNAc:undecaprenyl-phosphate GlcNAc-1-phosphate transferase